MNEIREQDKWMEDYLRRHNMLKINVEKDEKNSVEKVNEDEKLNEKIKDINIS